MRWLAAGALGITALPAAVAAQDNEAVSTAKGEIIPYSALRKTAGLEFGKATPGGGGGTLTVAPDGSASTGGVVVTMDGTQAAAFVLERDLLTQLPAYAGPLDTDTITLTHAADASKTLTLRNFTNDFNRTRRIALGLLTLEVPVWYLMDSYTFHVGGTINIAADQEPVCTRASSPSSRFPVTGRRSTNNPYCPVNHDLARFLNEAVGNSECGKHPPDI